MDRIKIAAAQLNATVGDVAGNAAKARDALADARADGADLLVLPEMFIGGYQLQDLVRKPAFIETCRREIAALATDTVDGPAMLIGSPLLEDGLVYNAVYLLRDGKVDTVFRKHELPNYGVFDEKRFFVPGPAPGPVTIAGVRVGVAICEDAWFPDVAETLVETGAEIIVVPNGSPYARNKHDVRMNVMVARVVETELPLLYLNLVGGQDDQCFDGGSFVLNPGGELAMQAPFFEEDAPIASARPMSRCPSGRGSMRSTARWRISSRGRSRALRRRIFSLACAGCTSWRCRTSSATCC